VAGLERNIFREGNILIVEETNPINRIILLQLKEHDKTLAFAEISTSGCIWVFTRMFVSEENRSKGYGSEVLTKLIEYLDRKNMDLYAYIYSSGSLSEKQLESWYRRYGFVDAGHTGYPMARYAGSHSVDKK
jgi:GNAT superfamily N-acetyltransferase